MNESSHVENAQALIFLAGVLEQLLLVHRSPLGDRIPLIAGPPAAIKLVVVDENLGGKTSHDAALD
jgi:hypothetical protein